MPQYLDQNGNPIPASPVYLDPNTGEPLPSHGAPPGAQQPGMLDPRGGWSPGDFLRGAVSGIKNIIAHPIDTIEGMGSAITAGGIAPEGMYPTTAPTGRPADAQANAAVQQQAQQRQADAAHFIGQNPAYAIGGMAGPAAVTAGAVKLAPLAGEAALEGAGRVALLGKTPEAAYESALKPSTVLNPAVRDNIIQTGLQQEIPVSKGGVEKIGDLIDDLNQKIEANIQAAGPNRTINPGAAVKNLNAVRAKFANQVNPTADLQAIDNSGNEFLDQFRSQPGGAVRNMTASEAQAMKQGTYRVLAGKFGEQGSAAVEAQKALARGLKEELANQFPEVNNLNADESKLLDLQPVLERAVNRISNHQSVGIGTPIVGTAARSMTGSAPAGAVATVLKAVLDNPSVKSRLAIAVSRGAKIPFPAASARVQTYSALLGSFAGSSANNTPGAQ